LRPPGLLARSWSKPQGACRDEAIANPASTFGKREECCLRPNAPYTLAPRKRSALATTDTELRLMAKAAIMGFNKGP